jgi:hypothetical protein
MNNGRPPCTNVEGWYYFSRLLVRADLWADKLAIIFNVHEYITKLQPDCIFRSVTHLYY